MNSLFPLLAWRIDGYPGEHTACDRVSVMKRQHRGLQCVASHMQPICCIWSWKRRSTIALHQPACWKWKPTYSAFQLRPQMRITQQPVTRSGEWGIKIRRLGCTSSRCVAIWQRVLICCVVCGALGQMCPLCTRHRAPPVPGQGWGGGLGG